MYLKRNIVGSARIMHLCVKTDQRIWMHACLTIQIKSHGYIFFCYGAPLACSSDWKLRYLLQNSPQRQGNLCIPLVQQSIGLYRSVFYRVFFTRLFTIHTFYIQSISIHSVSYMIAILFSGYYNGNTTLNYIKP